MKDDLLETLITLGAAGSEVIHLGRGGGLPLQQGAIRIGTHRTGPRPTPDDTCDVLLSADPHAPRPWVGCADLDEALAALQRAIAVQPAAATVLAQTLRATEALGWDEALAQESIAYSMLLACEGFRRWRAATPARPSSDEDQPRIVLSQEGELTHIRLSREARCNAFDARMRDQLCEALEFAFHADGKVLLSGAGPSFSAGGDLAEFGQASDVGQAHLIRTLRSPARLVRSLGPRLTVRVHGPCVGAGVEVPAAAARLTAAPDATFRLPEVQMGLIPGAGGTVSIPRRIGRQRTCWWAITGAVVDSTRAREWGLVDAIEP